MVHVVDQTDLTLVLLLQIVDVHSPVPVAYQAQVLDLDSVVQNQYFPGCKGRS